MTTNDELTAHGFHMEEEENLDPDMDETPKKKKSDDDDDDDYGKDDEKEER